MICYLLFLLEVNIVFKPNYYNFLWISLSLLRISALSMLIEMMSKVSRSFNGDKIIKNRITVCATAMFA